MYSDWEFLQKYGIVEFDEYSILNKERNSINKKIENNVITKRELMLHFKIELSLLNVCKQKINNLLENTHEVIDTKILVHSCIQIFALFQQMDTLFSIKEDLLILFINFCHDNVSYININQLDILLTAVSRVPNNKNNWIQLLKLYFNVVILQDDKMIAFDKGVGSLEDLLPLWKNLIRHLQHMRPEIVSLLFGEAISDIDNLFNKNISFELRPKYLGWCLEFKDLAETRALFNRLKELKPACRKLYLLMIAIELGDPKYKLDTVRKLYEEVITVCGGKNDVEVWSGYMRFEHYNGNRQSADKILSRALFQSDITEKMNYLIDQDRRLNAEYLTALSKEVIVIDD